MKPSICNREDCGRVSDQNCIEMVISCSIKSKFGWREFNWKISKVRLVQQLYIWTINQPHFRDLKTVKWMSNDILDSNMEVTDQRSFHGSTQAVQWATRSFFLKAVASIEKMYHASNLHIEFLKKEAGHQLNGLFMPGGLQRMPTKNYGRLDMVSHLSLHWWIYELQCLKDLTWLLRIQSYILLKSVEQSAHGFVNGVLDGSWAPSLE